MQGFLRAEVINSNSGGCGKQAQTGLGVMRRNPPEGCNEHSPTTAFTPDKLSNNYKNRSQGQSGP